MNERPIHFGLVGAGGIAQAYIEAFARCETALVVGVADVRDASAQAVAAQLGCPVFSSHAELAAATSPEAVVICTPPATHAEIAIELLSRGIHVLCEKPLAVDTESALDMLAAARSGGARLTMASKFRCVDDVVRARHIVASGILGEVVLLENTFAAPVDMSARWNSDPAVSGGGVLIDNGTHSLDLMRYFLGPLAEVQAIEGKRVQRLAVEDTVRLFARTRDGALASADLSWSIATQRPDYLSIHGTQGTICVGWKESKYRRAASDAWIVFGAGYNKIEAFRRQIDNFARALRGEEIVLVGGEDALASVVAVAAAYQSLAGNRWTAIPSPRDLPMPIVAGVAA